MVVLYLSTDSIEAEKLIEDTQFEQETEHNYFDLNSQDGEKLKSRIGFNTMSLVEINDKTSAKKLESIAVKLMKEGLFVAVTNYTNGRVRKYSPSDFNERGEILTLSMQLANMKRGRFFYGAEGNLLQYSNDPSNIRETHMWF